MALIGNSSVLSTALPRNKNFPQTFWINFFPFLSSSGAADGCVAYCFLAPYMMGAVGYGWFCCFFFVWLNCFSALSVYPGSDRCTCLRL